MKNLIIFAILWLGTSFTLLAQLPQTEAYLFDMRQVNDQLYNFTNPKYLTAFNPRGYNNQPHFVDERTLYLTVQMAGSNQTDIYSLNLYNKQRVQVTDTPDSEYSPTLTPTGRHFSCVREENDGQRTQRLWQFPIDRSNDGKRVLDMTKIGYHHWVNAKKLLLFVVSDPHVLLLYDMDDNSESVISKNIGRCFQEMPNGNITFIEKVSDKTWYIKELDPYSKRTKLLIEAPDGSEDYIITKDGTIIIGYQSRLFKYNPAYDETWVEIGDFSAYGIKNITRLAYNGSRKLVLINSL